MRNTGLDEAQPGIKIGRRDINNLRYAENTTLMTESEEERIHNCCLLSRLLPTSVVPHVMVKLAHLFSFLKLSFLCYKAASH